MQNVACKYTSSGDQLVKFSKDARKCCFPNLAKQAKLKLSFNLLQFPRKRVILPNSSVICHSHDASKLSRRSHLRSVHTPRCTVFKNFGGKRSETEINGGQSRSIKRSCNLHQLRTNLIGCYCLVVFLSLNMIGFQIKAKQTRRGARSKGQLNFEGIEVCRLKGILSSQRTFYLGKSC